jgi:hypothetical protein
MGELVDITARLNRLTDTVNAVREPKRQKQREEKAHLRNEHPEMADFLAGLTSVFNQPGDIRRIRVKDDTGLILDSNHWK